MALVKWAQRKRGKSGSMMGGPRQLLEFHLSGLAKRVHGFDPLRIRK
jgi:hypothetical protein